MDTIANFDGVGSRVAAADGHALRRRAIAEADVQAGAIPTVTIRIGEFEDNVACVLDDAFTFSNETTIGIQGECQRKLLGHGAVGINSDVEHASGNTRWVDCASFESAVFDGNIFARRSDAGDGVGSHVVTSVLKRGNDREGLARHKSTSAGHAVELQHSFTSSDDGLAFPSIVATNGHGLDGESGAVGHAFSDAVSETTQLDGGFRSKALE